MKVSFNTTRFLIVILTRLHGHHHVTHDVLQSFVVIRHRFHLSHELHILGHQLLDVRLAGKKALALGGIADCNCWRAVANVALERIGC